MTPKCLKIFNELLAQYPSARAFAHAINEDCGDVHRWRYGRKALTTRAIITLCRLFNCKPHDLNPDVFPPDLQFTFINKGAKE